ncbi:MAG: hypothetical protein GY711_00885 [bacterium]|nr:hypothetical protein [bacterium]
MWDYRIRNAPNAGPTELIRESEGYGLGGVPSLERDNRITRRVWIFKGSNPGNPGLPGALPGVPPNFDITVHIVLENTTAIDDANVFTTGTFDDTIEDIILRDGSGVPLQFTSGEYILNIPSNTKRHDPETKVLIDVPEPASNGEMADFEIEEMRLRIASVESSGVGQQLGLGWNNVTRSASRTSGWEIPMPEVHRCRPHSAGIAPFSGSSRKGNRWRPCRTDS